MSWVKARNGGGRLFPVFVIRVERRKVVVQAVKEWAKKFEYLPGNIVELLKLLPVGDIFVVIDIHFVLGELDAEISAVLHEKPQRAGRKNLQRFGLVPLSHVQTE